MFKQVVSIGIIKNRQGYYLLGQRTDKQIMAKFWEFPGGKIEVGESPKQALIRELHEELSINVTKITKFMEAKHNYKQLSLRLLVFIVEEFTGVLQGSEGQKIRWVDLKKWPIEQLLPGSRAIVQALLRPKKLLITPEPIKQNIFLDNLELALQQGIKLVRFRQGQQDVKIYINLAKLVVNLCRQYAVSCVLDDWKLAQKYDAYGWHCTSINLTKIKKNPLLGKSICCSVSVHNQQELKKSLDFGVDFILLSPVLPTTTHLKQAPLGWEKFKQLCLLSAVPVYALGGMAPICLKKIEQAGGFGLAAIRSLWPELEKTAF